MERTEWLKWRRNGIGSSDAPIILNVSKFSTALALWEEKISEEEIEENQSFIMDLGNEAEPRIRGLFEFIDGEEYEVALLEMEGYPFIRASLDGISPCKKKLIEIKLAGKEVYEQAKAGVVAECYMPQVQHQLMVSKADVCNFLVYPMDEFKKNRANALNADLLARVTVYPDKDYHAQLLEAHLKFWDCVQKKKPPQASDKDYKTLKGKTALLKKWKAARIAADKAEEKLESIRNEIIEAAKAQGHTRYLASGVRLQETARVGAVDYAKIPELKGVDLDKYRKKGSVSWRLEIVEGE